MKRRILSLLLVACMSASLLVMPANAASAAQGFNDVSDHNTLVAAECLRLLGAMDGYAGGAFRPEGQVTRAQFCKMSTFVIKDGESQLSRYRTVTVFPDVKPSHWAAPYINLASDASRGATGEDKTDNSIIKGFMDGKFHPERVVTVGQAVTILMRLLGYTDADMGGIWPDGYMAAASTVGLTDGVSTAASVALTRATAARLFVNLLRSDAKGGGDYGSSIAASTVEGMLTTSSATAPDGSDTAMRLGNSTSYSIAGGKVSTGALNGMKGTLLLNKVGKVMTFVPEIAGSSRTVTFASVKDNKLTTSGGESFTIQSTTAMVVNGESTTWAEGQTWLRAGMSLTLYIGASGTVEYIFVGSSAKSTAAVVVYTSGSTEGFSGLAGGTQYSIYKNGASATAGDMRPYDVAIYDPAGNTIRVCDTRLTGVYENAEPSLSNPTKIRLMGHDFEVLSTAVDTLSKLRLGDTVTLLLTEDNQVAGAVPAGTSGAAGNALGILDTGSTPSKATVKLLSGIEISGTAAVSESSMKLMLGQVVSVSSDRKGTIGLGRMVGSVFGDLDVTAKKLGSKLLSENVMIYQSSSSGVEGISLRQISSARIPSSGVVYARTNWAGRVDLLILSNVTGSDYQFGRVRYIMGEAQVGPDDPITGEPTVIHESDTIAVDCGNGKTLGPFSISNFTVVDDEDLRDGNYVGVKVNKNGTSFETFLILDKYGSVANSAWSSPTSVTIGGRSYTVPSDVLCYNKANGKWVSLDEARAFKTSSTIYTDRSGYVRIVEVQ